MQSHSLRVQRPGEILERSQQLAWKLAEVAVDPVPVEPEVARTISHRIIDNGAVAAAALLRQPVVNARRQAAAHPYQPGATVLGTPLTRRVSPEWAAWSNGVAVRELDFHDTFLAEDYAHPGDNISPLVAVAQHAGCAGSSLVRAIATAYEIQVGLARSISLNEHKIDHIAHLGPSVAAGLGTLLGLGVATIYQAINHSLHVTTTTRQSRKGDISSWKAYAPAFAGKVAIEAVDRAMRGESSPSPIYEGEDGVIAWLLGGRDARYEVALPDTGEPKLSILETYTKEYSAEYHSQGLIDLARRMRSKLGDLERIRDVEIRTSRHTHVVIGTGSNDPQKMDPLASRETLDHSAMYLFAVALEDGTIHHEDSYAPERASRPSTVRLWRKVRTVEDPEWTHRYHATDPRDRAFGASVRVTLDDGAVVEDSLAVADAHPSGARPFGEADYVRKFRQLAESHVGEEAQARYVDLALRTPDLSPTEVRQLSFASAAVPRVDAAASGGIFELG